MHPPVRPNRSRFLFVADSAGDAGLARAIFWANPQATFSNGWEVTGAVKYRWPDLHFLLATGCGATIRTCVGIGDTGTDLVSFERA
jgi:hypothetical protein